MRDLQLSGGDLLPSGRGFAMTDGAAYVRQRVATALAEPYGSDPAGILMIISPGGGWHRPGDVKPDPSQEARMTDATPERWKPVSGTDGLYEVSDRGNVRSIRVLNPFPDKDGYLRVKVKIDGVYRQRGVHQLVAEEFIGPTPPGFLVSHEDGDSSNNADTNLHHRTQSINQYLSVMHGTHAEASRKKCPKGHDLDGRTKKGRYCKECNRQNARKNRVREAAA